MITHYIMYLWPKHHAVVLYSCCVTSLMLLSCRAVRTRALLLSREIWFSGWPLVFLPLPHGLTPITKFIKHPTIAERLLIEGHVIVGFTLVGSLMSRVIVSLCSLSCDGLRRTAGTLHEGPLWAGHTAARWRENRKWWKRVSLRSSEPTCSVYIQTPWSQQPPLCSSSSVSPSLIYFQQRLWQQLTVCIL